MPEAIEILSDEAAVQIIQPSTRVLEVVTAGPRGPEGPVADLNVVLGFVGQAVDDYFVLHPQSFVYDQGSEVYHWDITHPLDHRPAVVVTDSAGTEYVGEVKWPAPNRVTIDFNTPLAGRATLT